MIIIWISCINVVGISCCVAKGVSIIGVIIWLLISSIWVGNSAVASGRDIIIASVSDVVGSNWRYCHKMREMWPDCVENTKCGKVIGLARWVEDECQV